LAPFARNAGSASAVLGFMQLGVGGLLSSGVGVLHAKGSFPTSLLIAITSAIALIILLAGRNKVGTPATAGIKANNPAH